jgi:hypothetical protein
MATVEKQKSDAILQYLRPRKKFPSVWCAGCGIGVVMGSIIRSIDKLGYDRDQMVLVSGIGCSSRLPVYCDFNTLHTTHGRAIAFAWRKYRQKVEGSGAVGLAAVLAGKVKLPVAAVISGGNIQPEVHDELCRRYPA